MKKLLFILFVSFLVVSCSNRRSKVYSNINSDNTLEVSVFGSQTIILDPWIVTVTVIDRVTNTSFSVQQEVMIDKLTEENLGFKWVSDRKCYVNITERGGNLKTIPIEIGKYEDD